MTLYVVCVMYILLSIVPHPPHLTFLISLIISVVAQVAEETCQCTYRTTFAMLLLL